MNLRHRWASSTLLRVATVLGAVTLLAVAVVLTAAYFTEQSTGKGAAINIAGSPTKVVVDLSPTVAGNMVETTWHESQETKVLADGWVRFTARVAGLDEVLWWVLGIGSHARVVEPKELRDRVHDEVRRMHAMIDGK